MTKRANSRSRRRRSRRGAILVLVAILMVLFLATAAFSVDVAYMYLVKAELRASTDAAAKAAVTTLGATEDLNQARRAAKQVAAANLVAGKPLVLDDGDIVFGSVQLQGNGSLAFVEGAKPYGAARVDGRKLRSAASGNVTLFFGGILGVSQFDTEQTATAARLDRDICLVLDRSGSMKGQKLADLKAAVRVFLQTLAASAQDKLVGLASYSTTATLDQALTSNLSLVRAKADAFRAAGWTNIGGGINVGRQILGGGHRAEFADKTMVLMTDGCHNTGTPPEVAAKNAKKDGIVIHTITFGVDADQSRMRAIAELTGGTFHHAPDGAALYQIFQDLARTISTVLTQ